jgi:hypothetical protein
MRKFNNHILGRRELSSSTEQTCVVAVFAVALYCWIEPTAERQGAALIARRKFFGWLMALLPVAPLSLALPVTAAPEPDDDDDDDDDDGPVFPEPDPKPQVYAVPLQHL